jgi:hypothetical protein
MTRPRIAFALLVAAFLAAGSPAAAEPVPAAPTDKAPADEEGFVSIFNGRDLAGWDGDPRLWSVADGAIRGRTTEENPARGNTFLLWRGGRLEDFILKIRFRIQNGNSGIQYRSKEVGKWVVSGYQAEVENKPGKVGFLYHEKGRGYLARVGDAVVIDTEGKKHTVGHVNDRGGLVDAGYYRDKDWNEYTIIARGNHLMHYLNGYQTMELIDEDRTTDPNDRGDRKGRAMEGLLALQIHAGPPMTVEFKDIRIKHLADSYGEAVRLFDGETLDGWTVSSNELDDTFGASNSRMTSAGEPRGYIRTEKDYTNYVVRLQMRHLKAGNGGVLLRMQMPDKVWPKSIEAQGMADNMGDIFNIGGFPMNVPAARTTGRRTRKMHPSNENPVGRWNDYEIYVSGGDLRIFVNRLLQNTATECAEVPGKICLQAEGAPMEFRNIVLIPILTQRGADP